jgi:1-deoxy-D-xylulose-5-phosphate synthase
MTRHETRTKGIRETRPEGWARASPVADALISFPVRMSLIDRVRSPADLKALSPGETEAYCAELREFLITTVSATGGHLGSNLGVVELTVALHRVFDFASDRLILDTSHQVYPHKVITGRRELFPTLRRTDGLSGFMARGESPYDVFTSGHAGSAVSAAYGMALADAIRGRADRRIVSLVGDAAAGSGNTFEALNHAGHAGHDLLVILNDNKWSISETVGGLSKYLNRIRTLPAYREFKKDFQETVSMLPLVGGPLSRWTESVKDAVANYMNPGHLFRELGWTYFGPENGHDEARLEVLLRDLRRVKGPVLLHVVTEKGRGYGKPTKDAAHALSAPAAVAPERAPGAPLDPSKACLVPVPGAKPVSYTKAFARAMARAMAADPRVTAVTAAMPDGTGLADLAVAHPTRVIDVGICEQHGVALAGGMAEAGLRPVVAIYSTFLQRGYDQIWQEVVVQDLPVVLALDRAGIVGGDGVTHQGLFDIAYLRTFPGITLMAPADPPELERMIEHALSLTGPSAVRYARASDPDAPLAGNDRPIETGKAVLLRDGADVAFVAYGSMVSIALDAARRLEAAGLDAAVLNARFARPLDGAAVEALARRVPLLITLEEHSVNGGFGEAVLHHLSTLAEPASAVVRVLGVPDRLVPHGERADWLARFGLSAEALCGYAVRESEAARAHRR